MTAASSTKPPPSSTFVSLSTPVVPEETDGNRRCSRPLFWGLVLFFVIRRRCRRHCEQLTTCCPFLLQIWHRRACLHRHRCCHPDPRPPALQPMPLLNQTRNAVRHRRRDRPNSRSGRLFPSATADAVFTFPFRSRTLNNSNNRRLDLPQQHSAPSAGRPPSFSLVSLNFRSHTHKHHNKNHRRVFTSPSRLSPHRTAAVEAAASCRLRSLLLLLSVSQSLSLRFYTQTTQRTTAVHDGCCRAVIATAVLSPLSAVFSLFPLTRTPSLFLESSSDFPFKVVHQGTTNSSRYNIHA